MHYFDSADILSLLIVIFLQQHLVLQALLTSTLQPSSKELVEGIPVKQS